MDDGVLGGGASTAATPSRPPIRLALLNEHRIGSGVLNRWLSRHAPDFVLVAMEQDWAALVRHPAFPPDVVILDADPVGPVSISARVRACRAAGSVVLLLSDAELSEDAAALGVAEVVVRGAAMEELDAIAERVRHAVAASTDRRLLTPAVAPKLSAGELRALRLYAAGSTTADVAHEMGVGYETVKTYLRRARAKYTRLGRPAGRRAELVRRAAEDGILG